MLITLLIYQRTYQRTYCCEVGRYLLDLGVVSVRETVETLLPGYLGLFVDAAPLSHMPQLEYSHLAAWLPWPF